MIVVQLDDISEQALRLGYSRNPPQNKSNNKLTGLIFHSGSSTWSENDSEESKDNDCKATTRSRNIFMVKLLGWE